MGKEEIAKAMFQQKVASGQIDVKPPKDETEQRTVWSQFKSIFG